MNKCLVVYKLVAPNSVEKGTLTIPAGGLSIAKTCLHAACIPDAYCMIMVDEGGTLESIIEIAHGDYMCDMGFQLGPEYAGLELSLQLVNNTSSPVMMGGDLSWY